MMNKNKDYIKVTGGGRLYIETKDFFKNKKVHRIINELMESEIVKKINK